MHVSSRSVSVSVLLLIAGLFSLVLVIGCGGEKKPTARNLSSDEAMIQAMYDTAITRLRNRDKSGLYDFEFEYIKEQFTFADYQAFPQIRVAEADTTDSFRVDSVDFYGGIEKRDSAKVFGTIVFRNFGDTISYLPGQWHTCYFHQGRWIRPSVGVIQNQLAFDSLKNAAGSAAEGETGG